MRDKLWQLVLRTNPVETKSGAAMRVADLFYQIEEAHGTEEARRLFDRWAKTPSQSEINKLKGWRILERYDELKIGSSGRKNKAQLAREIYADNERLPTDQQVTPRPRPTLQAIDHYIRDLIREREKAMKAGTWDGPIPDKWSGAIITKQNDL
jgi:hypothetical protein